MSSDRTMSNDDGVSCVVCQDTYSGDIVKIGCGHQFHNMCYQKLKRCPLCRKLINHSVVSIPPSGLPTAELINHSVVSIPPSGLPTADDPEPPYVVNNVGCPITDTVKAVIIWIFNWIVLAQIDTYIIIGLSILFLHNKNTYYKYYDIQYELYQKQLSEYYSDISQIIKIDNCVYKDYYIKLDEGNVDCFCNIYADLCINQTNICIYDIKIICGGDFTNCDALSKIDLNNSTLINNNKYTGNCFYDPNREIISRNIDVLKDFYNSPSIPYDNYDSFDYVFGLIVTQCIICLLFLILACAITNGATWEELEKICSIIESFACELWVTFIIKIIVLIYLIIYAKVIINGRK